MKRLIILVVALSLAIMPAAASANTPDDAGGDYAVRVRGDVTIADSETINSIIVLDGDLTIAGEVTDFALVINGDASVSGSVKGELAVISGDILVNSTGVVGDVSSVGGDVVLVTGSTITGEVREGVDLGMLSWVAGIFSILLWSGMTVSLVAAALVFATFGKRQLEAASQAMTGDVANTLLGGVFLWVAMPSVAGLAIVAVIGIPLGLGICFFLLPTFALLGYLVAGARLGSWLLRLAGRQAGSNALAEAGLGVLSLQLLILLPFAGVAIALLAGFWGSSALAYQLYRNARRGFEADTGSRLSVEASGWPSA